MNDQITRSPIHPSIQPSKTPFHSGWHGRRDLNPQPTVLETATLPIELLPYLPNLVCLSDKKGVAGVHPRAPEFENVLGNNFRHATRTDGAATFTDCKPLAFFHGHRRDDCDLH